MTAAQVVDLSFNYQFASEEFPEYAIATFSDRFELWFNGDNIAKLPNSDIVDVGTLVNAGLYELSGPLSPKTEMDGYSVLLSVIVPLRAGVNTVSFRVRDVGLMAGDYQYDSAAFIEALVIPPPPGDVPEPTTTVMVGTGLLLLAWYYCVINYTDSRT